MASFTSILESEPFTFLIGPTSKRLTVHASLVKGLSKPLDKLINDRNWKESSEEAAALENVNVETFSQFAEYCYTKNYRATVEKVAECEPLGRSADEDEEASSEKTARVQLGDRLLCARCGSPPKASNQPQSKLWDEFQCRKFGSGDRSHDDLRTQLDNMRPSDEVTTRVVQHAKLYVFADQDLVEYDIEENGVDEIVDLLNYVYENTSSAKAEVGASWDFRDLVMTFAVCKAEKLVEHAAFRSMMEDGAEVASDFARYIVKRLE